MVNLAYVGYSVAFVTKFGERLEDPRLICRYGAVFSEYRSSSPSRFSQVFSVIRRTAAVATVVFLGEYPAAQVACMIVMSSLSFLITLSLNPYKSAFRATSNALAELGSIAVAGILAKLNTVDLGEEESNALGRAAVYVMVGTTAGVAASSLGESVRDGIEFLKKTCDAQGEYRNPGDAAAVNGTVNPIATN